MADTMLEMRPALAFSPGSSRLGATQGPAGVRIAQRLGLSLASVAARNGQKDVLATKFVDLTGLALPARGRRVDSDEVSVLWSGPDQWLVQAAAGHGSLTAMALASALGADAAVTDQSDARAIIRLSGPRVRDLLGKGVMIDLHPRVFKPGMTAITLVAHIGVQVSAVEAGTFECLVPRSFAGSFWDWMVHSGSEYGIELE